MYNYNYSTKELLEIIDSFKTGIKALLDTWLENQVNFYNSDDNPKKPVNIRKCKFNFIDKIDNNPVINAYAIYNENEDTILMTNELYRQIFLFFTLSEYQFEHTFWMASLALGFCLSHEASHLFDGHCQLCKNNKLSLLYNEKTGLTYDEHQAIELEADALASGRVSDILSTSIEKNLYKNFYYKDEESFLSDSMRAICGVFYYLRFLGVDEHSSLNNCSHPPSFVRCFRTAMAFIEHYSLIYEDRKDLLFSSLINNVYDKDNIYREKFEIDPFVKNQKIDLDFVGKYTGFLVDIWNTNIKSKVEKFSRTPPKRNREIDFWNIGKY